MGLFGTNKKKKLTIEIDKKVYDIFMDKIKQGNLDEFIEELIRNYITESTAVSVPSPISSLRGRTHYDNEEDKALQILNKQISYSIVQPEIITEKTKCYSNSPTTKPNQFMQYLAEVAIRSNGTHYSPNTANGYKSAIATISKIIGRDLWQITLPEDIRDVTKQLTYNSYYNQKNKDSNKTLSNGLARYGEFLEYLKNGNIAVKEELTKKENNWEKAKSKVRDWAYKDNDFHKIITAFFIAKNFFDDRKINKNMLKKIFECIGGNNWGYFSSMSSGNPDSATGQFFSVSYNEVVKLSHEEITKTLTEYANCYYDETQEDYYKKIIESL